MKTQLLTLADGKIKGVYRFYETTGLPLDIINQEVMSWNIGEIDWQDCLNEAIQKGAKKTAFSTKILHDVGIKL